MPVSNLKFRLLWLLWAAVMRAQDHSYDLIRQNIEDMMKVEVTTASKKEQKLQNLLDDRHPEFNTTQGGLTTTQIRRGVYAKLTWQF